VVVLPLMGRSPDQAPDAVQVCASVTVHCSVVVVFIATLVLAATSLTTGGVVLDVGAEVEVSDCAEDCPQAARMLMAASPIKPRITRKVNHEVLWSGAWIA
jgi:hypothetical protein